MIRKKSKHITEEKGKSAVAETAVSDISPSDDAHDSDALTRPISSAELDKQLDEDSRAESTPVGKAKLQQRNLQHKTDKKSVQKAEKKKKPNIFSRIFIFFAQVVTQIKKVTWITPRQTVNYVIAVIIFVTLVVGFVSLLDYGFDHLMKLAFIRSE